LDDRNAPFHTMLRYLHTRQRLVNASIPTSWCKKMARISFINENIMWQTSAVWYRGY